MIRQIESLPLKATLIITKTVATALAKYNLILDSNQNIVLKTVRDSLKNTKVNKIIETKVTTDALPDFDISKIEFLKLRNDSLVFNIELECKKTALTKLNLELKLLILKNGIYTYIPQLLHFVKNTNYSSNTSKSIELTNYCNLTQLYQAYFYIYGSYYYNNKKIPYETVLFYDFKIRRFGTPGNVDYLQNFI